MKQDYWNEVDEHVVKKTGKKISEWMRILDSFQASKKKSNDVVTHLYQEYGVKDYRAMALTRFYLRNKANNKSS
jgi:hypothetical protein